MDGSANPCGEFDEGCIRFREVRELATGLIRADFANMASLTRSTLSGAGAENGRPCGLLSFTDPS